MPCTDSGNDSTGEIQTIAFTVESFWNIGGAWQLGVELARRFTARHGRQSQQPCPMAALGLLAHRKRSSISRAFNSGTGGSQPGTQPTVHPRKLLVCARRV